MNTKWRAKYETHHETRVKATHAVKTTYRRQTLCKQTEGDIPHENNLKAAHAMKTTYK